MQFRDDSFVIEYNTDCSKTINDPLHVVLPCLGALIFDKHNRPVAKIRQNKFNSPIETLTSLYKHEKWLRTNDTTWYNTFEVDNEAPQLNRPPHYDLLQSADGLPSSKPTKFYKHDECLLDAQYGGVTTGALGGATVGFMVGSAIFPGLGSAVCTFFGIIGGLGVGIFGGVALGSAVC